MGMRGTWCSHHACRRTHVRQMLRANRYTGYRLDLAQTHPTIPDGVENL